MESNNLNERAAKVLGWEHHKTDIIDFWINPEGNTANYPNWANSLDASMRDFMGLLNNKGACEIYFYTLPDARTNVKITYWELEENFECFSEAGPAEAFLRAALEVLE